MVVKLLVTVLMLPVALFVTALLEAVWLGCIAGSIVLGLPIVIIAAMFGGRLSDETLSGMSAWVRGSGALAQAVPDPPALLSSLSTRSSG